MEVQTTKNYDMFSRMIGNRLVNRSHVIKLKKAMKEAFLFTVIYVNENYEIIDGQHRFEAIKELGFELNYIVIEGYSHKEVAMYNSNMKNWGVQDYLDAYCDMDLPNYLVLRSLYNQFRWAGIMPIALMLYGNSASWRGVTNGGGGHAIMDYKEGKLKIKYYQETLNTLASVNEILKKFQTPILCNRLIAAVVSLASKDGFDAAEMIRRIDFYPTKIYKCNNTVEYKTMLNDLYNYNRKIRINLLAA